METYEEFVHEELFRWNKKMMQKSGLLHRLSKRAQTKVNELIPEKVHQVVTESIKKVTQAALIGSDFLTPAKDVSSLSLAEKEKLVADKIKKYKKMAAIEGAGTGAGGIFLGLADFPLLLSIKMKFLFEVATLYGFDVKKYEERLFILHVFQLAFSSDEHRQRIYHMIKYWDEEKEKLVDVDWRVFQQEYRDYIDLAKMLQLVPGIGAFVGAVANYNLLEHLGETAMNCYRLRLFAKGGSSK
jgi:uncharacterized protein (DUF697 family)